VSGLPRSWILHTTTHVLSYILLSQYKLFILQTTLLKRELEMLTVSYNIQDLSCTQIMDTVSYQPMKEIVAPCYKYYPEEDYN